MTDNIEQLMDSLYKEGTTSIDKEKVTLLNVFMQRAFPHVSKTAVADASSLLAVYCSLLCEGKHISVDGKELDAQEVYRMIDGYAKKSEGEFKSLEEMYEFYGSAVVVALYIYKSTAGLTNKELMYAETRGGDATDRVAAAVNGD